MGDHRPSNPRDARLCFVCGLSALAMAACGSAEARRPPSATSPHLEPPAQQATSDAPAASDAPATSDAPAASHAPAAPEQTATEASDGPESAEECAPSPVSSDELRDELTIRAALAEVRAIFETTEQERRRMRAFEQADDIASELRERDVPVDAVIVADGDARVVVRDGDMKRYHNIALDRRAPALREVLQGGTAQAGTYERDWPEAELDAIIVPVEDERGRVVGAILVSLEPCP